MHSRQLGCVRTEDLRGSMLYLRLHLLGFLQLGHDSINSAVPLLPCVLPGLPWEVQEVHAYQLPVGLCSGAYCAERGG